MDTPAEIIPQKSGVSQISLSPEALLDVYYRPLIDYKTPSQNSQDSNLLSEPLWQYRQIALKEAKIEEKLRKAAAQCQSSTDDISLLVRLSYQCSQVSSESIMGFSDLSPEDKKRLLTLAKKREQNSSYATSLLITLFLRDLDKDCREAAITLLQEGACEKEILMDERETKISLKLIPKNLLHPNAKFIDFSYGNFTGFGAIKKIDFSGQYLKKIQAESTTFKASSGCSFRYACLQEADLTRAHLSKCDFTGASLWKALFIEATLEASIFDKANAHGIHLHQANAKKSRWKQANLYESHLDNADFTETDCQQTDMTGACFKNTILIQANFRQATGLSAAGLEEAARLDNCQLSTQSLSRNDTKALKEKGTIEFTVDQQEVSLSSLEQLSAAYIRGEQIAGQGPSPAWPKESSRWRYDKEWHANQTQATLCDLTPDDELYPVLERFIHLTSDTLSYQSKRFEFTRLKKAVENEQLTPFIKQELHQPPSHQGRLGSIQIHKIQLNYHPALWQQYQAKKKTIQQALEKEGIKSPLANIDWHRGSMTGELPVINSAIGECWLFHGTGQKVMPLIVQNGLTTKFASKKTLVGYGALGKGIYCSDAFGKVATYVTCPHCQQNQCQCSPEKREQSSKNKKEMKAIFVTRVILGKVYMDKDKSRTHAEELPEGYHSAWGPYRESTPDSAFDRNEFIVSEEAQIYPEFCVFYTDNPPSLKQASTSTLTFLPALQPNASPVWQQLRENMEDYYRLTKSPAWLQQKNLSTLQHNIEYLYQQPLTKEQSQYLDALQKEIKPQVTKKRL